MTDFSEIPMRLTQFTYLHAIVECGFNVSKAAALMRTSQPGVSKQIRTLEQELGFDILARKKNKLLGLTPGGEAVFESNNRLGGRIPFGFRPVRSESLAVAVIIDRLVSVVPPPTQLLVGKNLLIRRISIAGLS